MNKKGQLRKQRAKLWPAFSQPEVIINLWLPVILMKMKTERKRIERDNVP